MTSPLLLVIFAITTGTLGARALRRADWPRAAPALGVLVWQAVSASVFLALVLSGASLALPSVPFAANLAEWVGACADALREHYASPGGVFSAVAGGLVVVLLIVRLCWGLAAEASGVWRTRRRLRQSLAVLATPSRDQGVGVVVLETPDPSVYCVPGRGGTVVVTRGALVALDNRQMDAVFAHEHSHLRGRHDLVLLLAGALRRAFPFVPIFRVADSEIRQLVEMCADDAALIRSDRRTLASAMVCLAEGSTPHGSLAAGGPMVLTRVQRLAAPVVALSMTRAVFVLLSCVLVVSLPLVIASAPAITAMAMHYCSLA